MNKLRLEWSNQTTVSYIIPDIDQIESKLKCDMVCTIGRVEKMRICFYVIQETYFCD